MRVFDSCARVVEREPSGLTKVRDSIFPISLDDSMMAKLSVSVTFHRPSLFNTLDVISFFFG
jgi:hypothetical protein